MPYSVKATVGGHTFLATAGSAKVALAKAIKWGRRGHPRLVGAKKFWCGGYGPVRRLRRIGQNHSALTLPEAIRRHALAKLDVSSTRAVTSGDTPYDAEAGREAGTKAAGVLTGGFEAKPLLQAGCFAVAPDLRALLFNLQSDEAASGDQAAMGRLFRIPTDRKAG